MSAGIGCKLHPESARFPARANCVTLGTALDEPRQTGAECQISAPMDYWCHRDTKPQFAYWGF